jgi:hypothetical protein
LLSAAAAVLRGQPCQLWAAAGSVQEWEWVQEEHRVAFQIAVAWDGGRWVSVGRTWENQVAAVV